MDTRTAEPQDEGRIRRIAEQSFQTSYSLSPNQIETIVEEAFSSDQLTEWRENDSEHLFVAVVEDDPIGFADVEFGDETMLRWLHVEPGHRGQGADTELFDRVRVEAENRNLSLLARGLVEDDEGGKFCEQLGFERSKKTKLKFARDTFFGYIYVEPDIGERDASDVEVSEAIIVDEVHLRIERDNTTPGTDGPFSGLTKAKRRIRMDFTVQTVKVQISDQIVSADLSVRAAVINI